MGGRKRHFIERELCAAQKYIDHIFFLVKLLKAHASDRFKFVFNDPHVIVVQVVNEEARLFERFQCLSNVGLLRFDRYA